MSKVCFIVAMNEERDFLQDFFSLERKSDYYYSSADDKIILLQTGIGVTHVVQTLVDAILKKYISPEEDITYINIGYVGSMYFEVGSIVQPVIINMIPKPEKVNNITTTIFTEKYFDEYETAKCVTANDFVETNIIPEGNVVCDMEAYYVGIIIPHCHYIKIVSDNLSMEAFDSNIKKQILANSWASICDKLYSKFKDGGILC